MKKKFPSSIVETFTLLISGIVLSIPAMLIFEFPLKHLNQDTKAGGIFIFWSTITLLIAYIVNHKRKQDFRFNININYSSTLVLMIFIVIFCRVGIELPIISFLKTEKQLEMMSVTTVLGALLLAPIFEELIFRGIILKGLLTNYSPNISITLSALIFSLMHFSQLQVIGAVFLGLFNGWIYYRTGNLGIVILLHFVSNLTSIGVKFWMFKNFQHYSELVGNPFIISVILFSVIMLVLCFMALTKASKSSNALWLK